MSAWESKVGEPYIVTFNSYKVYKFHLNLKNSVVTIQHESDFLCLKRVSYNNIWHFLSAHNVYVDALETSKKICTLLFEN